MDNDLIPQSSNEGDNHSHKNKKTDPDLEKYSDEILIGELLERLRHEGSEEVTDAVRTVITRSSSFSGPLPPPSMLGGYEDVQEGLAGRIVKMAELQQKHRQNLEGESVTASIESEKRGQNFALVLSVLMIIGAIALIFNGKDLIGTLLAGPTVIGLAYTFITGRKSHDVEPSDLGHSETDEE